MDEWIEYFRTTMNYLKISDIRMYVCLDRTIESELFSKIPKRDLRSES